MSIRKGCVSLIMASIVLLPTAAMFFVGCGNQTETSEEAKQISSDEWDGWEGETYTADFSRGLPSDWCGKSTDKTSESVNEGNLLLEQENSTSSKYAVYNVRENVSYTDFRMEMKVRITDYDTDASWFGLMYHVRTDGNKTYGYAVTKSIGGVVSHQIFGENKKFQQIKSVSGDSGDGEFHAIVLEVLAGSAAFFWDGRLISAFDCSIADEFFGTTYLSGSVAIALNNCGLEISELQIKGSVTEEDVDVATERTLAGNGYFFGNVNVAVISRLNDAEDIELLSEKNVSAIILTTNANGRVVDEQGEEIASLSDICSRLKNKFYPIFRTENKSAANKVLSFLRYERCISDAAVISSSCDLLDYVKERNVNIRGILDISAETVKDTDELWTYLASANSARANTLLLNSESATRENVDYVQARFKTVWTAADDGFESDKAIAAGANGIVTDNEAVAFERLQAFSAVGGRAGGFFCAAHRGNGYSTYENSIEAFVDAYESGATHIELDIRMSKDGKIVVMHDETLDRTTNGSGALASMTWAQISRYKIIKNSAGSICGNGANIPCLEEVYREFQNKSCILIVEIKTDDERIAGELDRLTKEYEMEKNIVVISFYNGSLGATNQLAKMSELMPVTATADLQSPNFSDLASSFLRLNRNNSGIDFQSNGIISDDVLQTFTARGYGLWVWTVDGSAAINKAWAGGIVGVTTNYVEYVAGTKVRLATAKETLRLGEGGLDEIDDILRFLQFISLDGQSSAVVNARVFSYEEDENSIEVVCCAKNGTGQTIYGTFVVSK